jgi:hypothetical protein
MLTSTVYVKEPTMPQPISLYKSLNRALSEAHRCAKWATDNGTPEQREKYQMLVKLMIKLVQEVTPAHMMRDPPKLIPDIAALNAANQREYNEGAQAAIEGKDFDADNPYHWQDFERNSAWNRGFHDQTKSPKEVG